MKIFAFLIFILAGLVPYLAYFNIIEWSDAWLLGWTVVVSFCFFAYLKKVELLFAWTLFLLCYYFLTNGLILIFLIIIEWNSLT